MISAINLGKHYGAQTLFRDVSVQFNPGGRYGVVGANGSGKSTFLRILTGEEEPSSGEVNVPRKARLGVLRQDQHLYDDVAIVDVVMMGHEELWAAMEEKERLLESAHEHFDGDRYQALEDTIMRFDGYTLEARAGEILEGLSIPSKIHREPLSVLSGGFKLRVLLARTLAADPDVLLLDEPTNHLDILSIRWLEKFLTSFQGTVVVVSHDHRFLNNVCTHIVDVDYERVTVYRGDYDAFVRQKHEDRERMEAEIEKNQKEIEDHKAFVERFKAKPTKARQAKSKAKVLDRIVIQELPRSSRQYPKFDFKQRRHAGRIVLTLDGVSKAFGDNQVLEGVSLKVERKDRLAIIGPNGIGKSTLLKIAMGRLKPDEGHVEWGYEAHPGYFAQDHHDVLDSDRQTLQAWLWDFCPGEPIGFVRSQLAKVLFKKDEVDKPLSALSGGEAARLVFAMLAVTQPTVLVLDEPTNHLDLEGIEALADGLERYDGSIVFVSHDRWFVGEVATRILEIRPDGLQDFRGTYAEYVERCGDDHLDVETVIAQAKAERRAKKRGR